MRDFHIHGTPHEESVRMYGDKVKVIGIDDGTCKRFKDEVPEGRRYASVAGLFNTGTNLLSILLTQNCEFKSLKGKDYNGRMWQVPWGKHNPVGARGAHLAPMFKGKGVNFEDVLPVVIVKDPLTWINSMCKNRYAAQWNQKHVDCPNFLDDKGGQIPVTVRFGDKDWGSRVYSGLIGMWNDWYNEYHDTKEFPRIIVRYEDVLFRPEEIVNDICTCAGGTMKPNFINQEATAKNHGTGNGKKQSEKKYGDEERRVVGYKDEDLKWFEENIDVALLEELGYKLTGLEEALADLGRVGNR